MKQRRNNSTSIFALDVGLGKLPPQALEMEEAIIGACMLEKGAFASAQEILTRDCFYDDKNQMIFGAMEGLTRAYDPIDILTVTNYLKTSGELDLVGGPYAITQITNRVASAANIQYHARIVFQKYVQRKLIEVSGVLLQRSYDDTSDALTLLSDAYGTLEDISHLIISGTEKSFKQQVIETQQQISKAKESGKHIAGLATGFPIHDRITSGRVNGDLIIIGARPSAGKTTMMLQEIYNISVIGDDPVGVFSLESPFQQFIIKFLSNMTSIDNRLIRTGQFNAKYDEQVSRSSEQLMKKNIHLKDVAGVHIDQIRAQAQLWKKRFGIKAVYLDYLQLASGTKDGYGSNRDQEIGHISRGLKKIAMDLNIPVIALSQLSRGVDNRQNKRPILSDLRESGNIEQDADVVEFLYRPDYYEKEPVDENGNDLRGLVERIVAKNRNGALDNTYSRFIREFSRFKEIDTLQGNYNNESAPSESGRITRDFTESNKEGDVPF